MTAPKHESTQPSGGFRPGCFGVLVMLALTVILPRFVPVLQPHVVLPAEKIVEQPLFTLIPGIGEQGQVFLTNSLVAWLIAVVIVLIMGYVVGRNVKGAMARGEYVLSGFTDVFVSLVEVIYNLTEATAGRWTRAIFPYFATIVVLVLVINWMELMPGMDTIGILRPSHEPGHGYIIKDLGPVGLLWEEVKGEHQEAMSEHARYGLSAAEAAPTYEFIPLLRVTSTDLNFTLSLALVSVLMTQVLGLRALGVRYLEKFFQFRALVRGPMGALDFAVGLLELVSEFSKILSFSFRLFGNLFAGSVLLFVMGTLLPLVLFVFYGLEFFVGIIQAFVFGMLTMVFMAQATQHH